MHHTQDIIIAAGSVVLSAALVPTILGKQKPELSSSLICGTVLTVFAATYLSLSLWFSAITTFITAACWYILAAQRRRQG